MNNIVESIQDYCSSEYFLLLDTDLKEHAESLLLYWCHEAGDNITPGSIEHALNRVAYLDMPLAIRQGFPGLLKAFLEYLSATGRFSDAGRWAQFVSQVEGQYIDRFREDGSVRGETFRKKYTTVGRNDSCPCGSGKKYKKCCME